MTVPLASLTPSLEAQALNVLVRANNPLTGSQLARLARHGSRTGIGVALDRLADSGLVLTDVVGASRTYLLNRDHLLADAICAAVQVRDEFIRRLGDTLRGWDVPCLHGSLFGSVARGEAGPASDIDLLLLRPDAVPSSDVRWETQVVELQEKVYAWTGNDLSPFDISGAHLRRMVETGDPLVGSWLADGLHLAGSPLTDFVKAAR